MDMLLHQQWQPLQSLVAMEYRKSLRHMQLLLQPFTLDMVLMVCFYYKYLY